MNCELCEQPAAEGYLCDGCEKGTGQRLAAFPYLYGDLAEFLPRSTTAWSGGGRSGTVSHAPLPVAEEPFVLRGPGGMVGVLEDWRKALHADRGWTPPVVAGGIERRIKAAVRGLAVNLPWIAAEWPEAGTFAGEVRELYKSVTSITAPPERKGVRMGNCPAVYDGVLCGAVLLLPRGESTIKCTWCTAEYAERLWVWLRGVQDELWEAS